MPVYDCTPSGGGSTTTGLSSFNGRTGAVVPQDGDYTAAQVGAADATTTQQALQALSDEIDGIIAGTSPIALPVASDTKLGGVKVGTGMTVEEDGTLNVTASGKKYARFVVGTSTAGYTSDQVDYLCDGTEDQVEINQAISNLPSTGGEVLLLDGSYNISGDDIIISQSGVTLCGCGAGTILNMGTLIYPTNASIRVVSQNINGVLHNTCIQNLHLVEVRTRNNSTNTSGINAASPVDGLTVQNCIVEGAGESAIRVGNNSASSFAKNIKILNCLLVGCNNGVGITKGSGVTISGVHVIETSPYITIGGISVNGQSGFAIISGNRIEMLESNTTATCISCSNNCVVQGNIVRYGNTGIMVASNLNVTGNQVFDFNSIGINVIGQKNIVSNNTIIRGYGDSGDYTSSQNTIFCSASSNLFSGNLILGKNYMDKGSNNEWANNKFE